MSVYFRDPDGSLLEFLSYKKMRDDPPRVASSREAF